MNCIRFFIFLATISISQAIFCLDENITDEQRELFTAVEQNNLAKVTKLLEQGVEPNFSILREEFTVISSSAKKRVELNFYKEFFPELYKNIPTVSKRGESPLYLACKNGSEKIVRELLDHDADPQFYAYPINYDYLLGKIDNDERARFQKKIEALNEPEYQNNHQNYENKEYNQLVFPERDLQNYIPLHVAIVKQNFEILQMVVNHAEKNNRKKEILEMRDEHGNTPLMKATIQLFSGAPYASPEGFKIKTTIDMIEFLVAEGANLNVMCDYGQSLLGLGIYGKISIEFIKKFLIQMKKQNINEQDILGYPLHAAVYERNYGSVFAILEQYGELKDIPNKMGNTPLYLAAINDFKYSKLENPTKKQTKAYEKNYKIIKLLIKNGVDYHKIKEKKDQMIKCCIRNKNGSISRYEELEYYKNDTDKKIRCGNNSPLDLFSKDTIERLKKELFIKIPDEGLENKKLNESPKLKKRESENNKRRLSITIPKDLTNSGKKDEELNESPKELIRRKSEKNNKKLNESPKNLTRRETVSSKISRKKLKFKDIEKISRKFKEEGQT